MLLRFSQRLRVGFSAAILLFSLTSSARADTVAAPVPPPTSMTAVLDVTAPTRIWIPSEKPSGNPTNDRIWLTYYPVAETPDSSAVPAVVLLHYLGAASNKEMHSFARYLAKNGIASAVITLPYHRLRSPRGDLPINYFVAPNAKLVQQAFDQSASDVSTVVTWLTHQKGIDSSHLGAVGVSLGAIITHLAMGRDARLIAGVAMLGGGDLLDIYRHSYLPSLFIKGRLKNVTPQDKALIDTVDPLANADKNQPRRVLMIQGSRDLFIPPRDAEKLWVALGKPPIQWLDVNHVALELAQPSVHRTTLSFLRQAWAGKPLDEIVVPKISVPTIQAGFLMGLDSSVTPAIQLEAFKLGQRRDHLPLLHGDIGISGRGPYVGLAATLNMSADIGVGRRLGGSKFRPYVSWHVAF